VSSRFQLCGLKIGEVREDQRLGGGAFNRNIPSNPNEAGAFDHGEAMQANEFRRAFV
jgi:hypothetical protein